MPYKDLERKKEWERLHRLQRLARRRELRRITTARKPVRPEVFSARPHSGAEFPVPPVTRGGLDAFDPKLGMAAGGATLAIAGICKKGWRWWIVDCGDCPFSRRRGLIFILVHTKRGRVAVGD